MRASVTLLAALPALAGTAPAQRTPSVAVLDTAVLLAPRLAESSGVAASRRQSGLYWTHNDSGDGPVLYATDSTGRDLGFVRVTGARALDWEDLASGPCIRSVETCLYIGDIGDNRAARPYVVVYRVVEPAAPRGPSDTLGAVEALDSILLRYPDHPHDAEALAVTPDGVLLVITKDRTGPAVLFRAPLTASPESVTLGRVGALPLGASTLRGRLATGAALSPDGTTLVVRTYVSLHFFRLEGEVLPTPLTMPGGLPIPVVEAQGEAVTFDGPDRLTLTSERDAGHHAILMRLRVAGIGP